jgi:hypothetical protein
MHVHDLRYTLMLYALFCFDFLHSIVGTLNIGNYHFPLIL